MILPVVLIMITLITGLTTKLATEVMGSAQGLNSFMSYLERMYLAESKLIELENKLKNKIQEVEGNNTCFIQEINKTFSSNVTLVGFFPDNLEYGLNTGTYIFKLEVDSLQTYWTYRLE